MPDSAGKRQRREVKAKKAAAVEERRLARSQRRADRANGLIVDDDPSLERPLTEAEAERRRQELLDGD